ncbi:chemokine XC receptor 1 [Thalassophryne amazonica]|uniref:chemokine XC receptor 1 n=1 Tax=Thalassophryne amazonica TaxID=390379 RepID=UPI001471C7DF|nr:chemokine XC receptor 1 [Thalassophryne amazonica]
MNNSSNPDYLYDDTDDMCDSDEVARFGSIVIPFFLSVVITLSLMGNILVLIILALYENLKSVTNIFILNLAISDLIFTTGLPFWAIYHIWGWIFPESLCKAVTFVFFTGFYSSVLFLSIMTIYRYLAIVHPLSELSTLRVRCGILVSLALWIVSAGAAVPSLLYSSITEIRHTNEIDKGCEYEDILWETIGVCQQNVFFLAAFAVMAFCYIQILLKITRTRSQRRKRAVKLIFCIVAVFFLGWIPYNVIIFLKMLAKHVVPPFEACETSNQIEYAFHLCRLVAFSHCCLNPIFYAFVGVKFRSHLKLLLKRVSSRPAPVEKEQMRMQHLISQGSLY